MPGVLTNSLSEGEAALSPGDARWYSTYAGKIGRLAGIRERDGGHKTKGWL